MPKITNNVRGNVNKVGTEIPVEQKSSSTGAVKTTKSTRYVGTKVTAMPKQSIISSFPRITGIDAPFDKDPAAFFEIEKIVLTKADVPTITKLKEKFSESGGSIKGILYAQPYGYLDYHVLKAVVSISFQEDIEVTELSIKMHNFGETNFVFIKDVRVSDGSNEETIPGFIPTSVGRNVITDTDSYTTNPASNRYSLEKKWLFPKKNIRKVVFELEQSNPYPLRYVMAVFTTISANSNEYSNIGVITDVSSKSVFHKLIRENNENITLDSSPYLSSLLTSMIPRLMEFALFNPYSRKIPELSKTDPSAQFSLNEDIGEDGLITIPREETNRWRYAIGISEIGIGKRTYAVASEFISSSFEIPFASSVTLETDDMIPLQFPDGDWLAYYISLNEGLSWSRISPVNHPPTIIDGILIPKMVHINADVPDLIKEKNPSGRLAYIDTSSDIRSIKLKIELRRPNDADFRSLSPQVFYYRLKVIQ